MDSYDFVDERYMRKPEKIYLSPPTIDEGEDGEMRMVKETNGNFLYLRASNHWYRMVDTGSNRVVLDTILLVKGLRLTDTSWDDMKFPFTRDKQGQSSKPDYDFTNMGLLFPYDDPAEIVYITSQMLHAWKQGTTIYPHIHYIQEGADQPTFKMDYRFFNTGDLQPGSFTTVTFDNHVFDYASGDLHQIASIDGGISMEGLTLSCLMDMKVYRDDDLIEADVLGKEFDIHYEINSFGSEEEYIKTEQKEIRDKGVI